MDLNLIEIGKRLSAASKAKIKAAIDALAVLMAAEEESDASATESWRDLLEATLSYNEREAAVRQAIRDALGNVKHTYVYLVDCYDDYAVYQVDSYGEAESKSLYYQVSYSILDGQVNLGQSTSVRKVVTYEPIAQESADVELTGDLVPLVEKGLRKDGTVPIKVIQPGWGSSGFYGADVLKRDGPKVFTSGLHMHIDHPTAQEEAQRPERSVNTIGAVLTSDARWDDNGPAGPGLYADAKPLGEFKERLPELAPHIGVSIRAMGKAKSGEAEGKRGNVIESIVAAKSIDFVTTPGAGGKVLELWESARGGRARDTDAPMGGKESKLDEKEAQALREAATAKDAEIARLKEALLLREARDYVAETLAKVEMPELTRVRLTESLSARPVVKDGQLDREGYAQAIQEAARTELEYIGKVTGTGQIKGMGSTGEPAPVDKTKLIESWRRGLGLTEEQAKIAIEGR